MDIIIPMSWKWTRFQWPEAQEVLTDFNIKWLWSVPKPFIEIDWKSMIEIVLDTLNIPWRVILILNSQHVEEFEQVRWVLSRIKNSNSNTLCIESWEKLQWPATTVLEAKKHISDKALLIINSDQFFTEAFSPEFIQHIKREGDSAWTIVTYDSKDLKNSFAVLDKNWKVIKVVEKPTEYINNSFATTWVYFWRKWSDFLDWCHQMIEDGKKVNWEYYIAPVYTENIATGYRVDILQSSNVHLVWTPLDLKAYLCR